jgi:PAS domain S-box-containing protein
MIRPRTTTFGLCACLGLAAWSRLIAEPTTCRVMMENTWPPFATLNAAGQPEGFAVELMRAIAQDQGLRLEFDLRPWKQVYGDFRAGQGDILGLVASSDERAAWMDFSVPFEQLVCGLYYRSDRPPLDQVSDLRGKRLAVIKDTITHEFALKQSWDAILVSVDSHGDGLRAVERGECDALLGTQVVADYQIKHLGLAHVVRGQLEFPEAAYRLCFAVHPGQKALLAKINQGLYDLRVSRQHDALHETWLGPLEPQQLRWRDVQPFLLPLTAIAVAALGVLLWQRRLLRQLSRQAHAIRQNEERLRLVFEGSQDGFWDWEVASNRVLRSPRWASMLGYTPEEIGPAREEFQNLIHPDDKARILADEKLTWEGKNQFSHELRLRAKSGDWKWILDRGKVVARNPATGEPLRITGTHTDITARKLAEEEAGKLQRKMQEAQKLESLGVLAGGIAHDFNNLLTVILGNSALARLEPGVSAANLARLENVATAADRAAELCRQLLAYAGQGSFSIMRLNVNDLVTETTRLLEMSICKQARLEFALAPALPRIEADASQIRQIIMNLVINASEAVEGKPGAIRLTTHVVVLPQPGVGDAGSATMVAPGDYVCMEISDSGAGMTPEVLARIFDPFFSTKFTGRGLGLAAVLGIVRTHGGTLKVQSTPGHGSTFRVYLPVSQKQTVHPFAPVGEARRA